LPQRRIDRALVEHFVEHREEIGELLERHGWFAAQKRMAKANAKIGKTLRAVMDAPVTGPADVLAKIKVVQPWAFDDDEDSADDEEYLLVAIRRDLEALAGAV
jgi:hypothetical protein